MELYGLIFIILLVLTVIYYFYNGKNNNIYPPGPFGWPLIGSLHLLKNYEKIPFEAFTKLRKIYGDIFSIRIGSFNCVVVNGNELTKEVLLAKADHFSDRPNFHRFRNIFGGNKNNSVAFCDSSFLQEERRKLIKKFTIPKSHSLSLDRLDRLCQEELNHMILQFNMFKNWTNIDLKSCISKATANVFIRYFCSIHSFSYDDKLFNSFILSYDAIFWEVNNGRLMDFFPWTSLFAGFVQQPLNSHCKFIRSFVENKILLNQKFDDDFLNTYQRIEKNKELILFALEDLIGGHSAVTNVILRILVHILEHGDIKKELQKEIQPFQALTFKETRNMVLLNACFYETVRLTCSPIIPHRSKRDTSIGNYCVKNDTVIFINNHFLNYSPSLWYEPLNYNPKRFIDTETGFLSIPAHFQPFSIGRRSCVGYKLTQLICTFSVAHILKTLDLSIKNMEISLPPGMLATKPGPVVFCSKIFADTEII